MSNFILVTPNAGVTAPLPPTNGKTVKNGNGSLPHILINTHTIAKAVPVEASDTYQGGTELFLTTGVESRILVAETMDSFNTK